MSVNHRFEIDGDPRYRLVFNFSGVDSSIGDPSLFKGAFYAYDKYNGTAAFTCNIELKDVFRLYDHLNSYSFIPKKSFPQNERFVEIPLGSSQLIETLNKFSDTAIIDSLKHLFSSRLSPEDISTVLGRKESLLLFEEMLFRKKHREKDWQDFFEKNEWIFGYGLKYKYLQILQRESRAGKGDIDGSNSVISDFLMSDSRFTKLVELKKPDTKLFKLNKNRSDSWGLSSDLTDSVSQILAQKASWEIESSKTQYTANGNTVKELTHDVECLLIIGQIQSINGSDREIATKLKTLELFRRNLRNIEIITYDELLQRAKFIVKNPC